MTRKTMPTKELFWETFRNEVALKSTGFTWEDDLLPWLGHALRGVKFGDDGYDWSLEAARDLADMFIEEASTW